MVPVAKAQVGCMVVLAIGADGGDGCAFMPTFPDDPEVHDDASVTV
jgi:hypothetical protein